MAFQEVRFPDTISRGARGGPERRTQIVELASGGEERNASWANSRRRYDVAYEIRRADDLVAVVAFFRGAERPTAWFPVQGLGRPQVLPALGHAIARADVPGDLRRRARGCALRGRSGGSGLQRHRRRHRCPARQGVHRLEARRLHLRLFTFVLEWTSGANAGRRTEVLGIEAADGIAVLKLLEAPVRSIAEGDAFTIRAGCDSAWRPAARSSPMSSTSFPHIPRQDAVLRYATKDGGHEGSVL